MAPMPTRYFRKLSAIERFALGVNAFIPFNADLVIEGQGTLSTPSLKAAVAKAAQANPGSRVRLQGRLGFAKWVDSGIAPEVREIDAPDWDGRSDLGAPFLDEKFDALPGGPVCNVLLVPGSPARIVIRTLHAAFDGGALCHWAAEIFRALRGEALQGSPCTHTDWDIARKFQDRVNMSGLSDYAGLQSLRARRETRGGAVLSNRCLPAIPPSIGPRHDLRYVWRSLVFPAVIPNALAKCAIFLAEYARRDASGPVTFNLPVDLRGRREAVLSLGNLTGTLQIPVVPGDTARSFVRQVSQQLGNYADCNRPAVMRLLPWMPLSVIRRAVRAMEPWLYEMRPGAVTAGVTSLGPLSLQALSAPEFTCSDAFVIPAFAGKMNAVVVSTGRHTTVTIATPERYNADGQLDRLMDALRTAFGAQPASLSEASA